MHAAHSAPKPGHPLDSGFSAVMVATATLQERVVRAVDELRPVELLAHSQDSPLLASGAGRHPGALDAPAPETQPWLLTEPIAGRAASWQESNLRNRAASHSRRSRPSRRVASFSCRSGQVRSRASNRFRSGARTRPRRSTARFIPGSRGLPISCRRDDQQQATSTPSSSPS